MSLAKKREIFKVLVIGDANVGKSCVITRYINKRFESRYRSTIGSDFLSKTIEMSDRTLATLQLWDTAGQERFQALGSSFYRGTDMVVIVFDLTNPASFDHVPTWLDEFRIQSINRVTGISEDCPVVIVGNKSDLVEQKKVPSTKVQNWCRSESTENSEILYFETSARDGTNVERLFAEIARIVHESKKKEELIIPELPGVSLKNSPKNGVGLNTIKKCCGGGTIE